MMKIILDNNIRDNFIFELRQLVFVFLEIVQPNLDFADDSKKDEFIQEYIYGTGETYTDDIEDAYENALSQIFSIQFVNYQYFCFTVSLIYHCWEQQLISFLFKEIERDSTLDEKKIFEQCSFKNLSTLIKESTPGVDIDDKIIELKTLNNAIKHGNGACFQKLKSEYSSLIKDEFTQETDLDKFQFRTVASNTLLEEVINIENVDLKSYLNILVEFWKKFPGEIEVNID